MTEKESLLITKLPDRSIDFVIVTALAEERDAVLQKMPGYRQLSPAKNDIRTYFQADLPVTFPDNTTGTYQVITMCLLGMGRVQAGVATADAIRQWHPRYIMLVGIAGGISSRNVHIGDILISDQVVDYELQKLTPEGPEIRWDVQHADPRLLNACNNFRGRSWHELITIKRPGRGSPNCHIGPIASGDKVIAFSDILVRYQDVWPKLLGVEMEAAGAATAAFQSADSPGFFMVRAVSDLADENKSSSDVKKWRSYACDVAASFTIALLRSGPIPVSERANQEKTKQVELILEGEFSEFTSNRQEDIVGVLAALLRIDPNNIRVLKVLSGSIVITLEMPDIAANRLYEMATMRDIRIISLGIKSVLVEGRVIIEFSDKNAGIQGNKPEHLRMAKTILILAANPKNTPHLRLDEEVREIENGLQRAQRRDDFILKQKWATRPVDVRRAMLDFKPNVVHFCGHGSGEEGIAFEDETGQAKLVNADTLAGFFELFADKLECVVLNACYSEVQAEAVAKYIPYVIGMKKAIGDTAAIEFSVAFYDALGAGNSIEFAYKLACIAIQWSSMPEHLTPTLKSKKSAQPIVNRAKLDAYAESLRSEIAANLHLLDEPIAKMGFLSDIRYVELVKSGNIAYFPFIIFDKVIRSYNRVHQLNSQVLKCRNHDPKYQSDVAQTCKYELAGMLQELIDIFETKLQLILDSLDYDEEENESNYLLYALRFEAEANKIWLEDTYTTLNFLRADAWDIFRKNQDKVDLPRPLMDRLNMVYQKLYVINDFHINNLRNKSIDYDEQEAIRDKEVLIDEINILIGLFDKYFPRISANFRK